YSQTALTNWLNKQSRYMRDSRCFKYLLKPLALWKALVLLTILTATAQPFQFAHVTDSHIGGVTGAEDLRRTVADIHANPNLDFGIFWVVVNESGSDAELPRA